MLRGVCKVTAHSIYFIWGLGSHGIRLPYRVGSFWNQCPIDPKGDCTIVFKQLSLGGTKQSIKGTSSLIISYSYT